MFRLFVSLLCVTFFLQAQEFTEELAVETMQTQTDDIALLDIAPLTLSSLEEPTPLVIKPTKNLSAAVFLSSLLPGLGHYYLGDARTGSEILGGSLLAAAGAVAGRNDESLFLAGLATAQSIAMYGMFAAYRDVQIYNGNVAASLSRENFKDLSSAPFQWSVMKKPEVWAGIAGALAVGITVSHFALPKAALADVNTKYVLPMSAFPIGIGEESLFRGYLQSSLCEKMPAWGAITTSSLIFGAAHIPNAQLLKPDLRWRYYAFGLPLITSFGGYVGWLAHKNHSLKESVAVHAWYDFVLMFANAVVSSASLGRPSHLFHSFSF
jgi:membrane protease YdiL (CAAX protease family)